MNLDVVILGSFAHKINAGKFLGLTQLLLAILMPTTTVALMEDTALTVDEVFMEVLINQQSEGVVIILRSGDRLFAESKDLRRWRLLLPDKISFNYNGQDFYSFDKLAGLTYKFDETTQVLMVEAPPNLFDFTLLKGTVNNFSVPTTSPLGGFINYNVNTHRSQGRATTSGLLELVGFGKRGMVQTTISGLDLERQASAKRLETTWIRDVPTKMSSLRFGDVISGASTWGGGVRLGGVQWSTNFSTQPSFITFPLPMMSGEAALPSSLDLYDSNGKVMSKEVLSGPFSIEDMPIRPGKGDARLVLRDILGREQVFTKPYHVSPLLLKQGLQDYSYELGFVRRNFSTDSNNYGRPVVVGTHRYGITKQFTGDIHAKLLSHMQTVGLGGVFLLPNAGMFSGSLAMSHSGRGVGGLLKFGIHSQSNGLNFGANTELANQRFTKLGLQLEEFAPQQISKMFVNLHTANYGSFAVNFAQQVYRHKSRNEILEANFTRRVGKKGNLSASVIHSVSDEASTAFYFNFKMSLGNKINANISTSTQSGRKRTNLMVSRDKPEGNGVGYRLVAGAGASDYRQMGVSLQNDVGNYTLVVDQSQDKTAFRSSASGGVAFLGGSAFLSRRIVDSFAVVQLPDYSDIGIYADNKIVGHTDVNGYVIVPNIRSYEKNSVRIEQADLPLDVQLNAKQLDVSTYFRSGLLLKFPVRRSRGALISVVLENGEPLPAGAQVQIIIDNVIESEAFPVGFRGEVYLVGLATSNWLKVTWREQSCEFDLSFPETTDPLPHLGTYTCIGVEP